MGWLFAIARNAAVDALPSRAAASHSEVPDLQDDGPGPDERASAAEEAFRVHAAVDGLPDQEREVIELAYFDGLSQSQVTARLGRRWARSRPERVARSRISPTAWQKSG